MPHTDLNYAIVIPARYKSSRYPGKPLIDLVGKSMIQRVWEQCSKAVGSQHVYIATDDDRILQHCASFTDNIVMTNEDCLTGTDRVAEVAFKLNLDYVINVQGDEPIIDPAAILAVKSAYEAHPDTVINAMSTITSEDEYSSLTIPKVVASPTGKLFYMSRSPIPGNKDNNFNWAWKQVCIYAFPSEALKKFAQQTHKTPLEEQEDIEILRFLEMGINVQMVKVDSGTIAIDTPVDREKVIRILND
jgi:3-deoxy-manno-octulosonate cytidylyltransferase (CMP-KDO synthetase)